MNLRKGCFITKKTAKSLKYSINYMEEDIQNYSLTVMFRGTPCIRNLIIVKKPHAMEKSYLIHI